MTKIVLRDVRISYPKIFVAEPYQAGDEPRYSCVFLAETGGPAEKLVQKTIKDAAKEKWGAKAAAKLASFENNPNKYCFSDGNRKPDLPGFADNWALSAIRKEKDGAPKVVDRAKNDLKASDGVIYAGCYVNTTVDIWVQDGTYSGIRCTLVNVQFVKKGESFGGSVPATADDLDDLGYDADEDEDLL